MRAAPHVLLIHRIRKIFWKFMVDWILLERQTRYCPAMRRREKHDGGVVVESTDARSGFRNTALCPKSQHRVGFVPHLHSHGAGTTQRCSKTLKHCLNTIVIFQKIALHNVLRRLCPQMEPSSDDVTLDFCCHSTLLLSRSIAFTERLYIISGVCTSDFTASQF